MGIYPTARFMNNEIALPDILQEEVAPSLRVFM
jgi:hypothetical protein